jgi:hypothetical protein
VFMSPSYATVMVALHRQDTEFILWD